MNDLFADTSFYVALCFPKDANHAKAVELARTHDGQLITTEYVLCVDRRSSFEQAGFKILL